MKNKKGRQFYAAASLIVIVLGLLSRRVSDYIPNFIDSYLGDALWALMIYFIVRGIFIDWGVGKASAIALLFCYVIELTQLYHAPWIDSIRKTTFGGLVLGYGFLWIDIKAYFIGVLIGLLIDKIRKSKYAKKVLIGCVVLILAIGIAYYFINPAKLMEENSVKEIGLYSVQTNKSLWDLGYAEEDFVRADPGYGDFKYNAVFAGKTLESLRKSLETQSKSFRFFPDNTDKYRSSSLYVINIQISQEEGFVFITRDLEEEASGRFVGYKYEESARHEGKWMIYYNKELGKTLKALREKGDK